jgi:hypothetical protein
MCSEYHDLSGRTAAGVAIGRLSNGSRVLLVDGKHHHLPVYRACAACDGASRKESSAGATALVTSGRAADRAATASGVFSLDCAIPICIMLLLPAQEYGTAQVLASPLTIDVVLCSPGYGYYLMHITMARLVCGGCTVWPMSEKGSIVIFVFVASSHVDSSHGSKPVSCIYKSTTFAKKSGKKRGNFRPCSNRGRWYQMTGHKVC